MAPKVSIIVPLAGGAGSGVSAACRASPASRTIRAHEIIVVDDASVGLEPLLSQLAGDVEVLRNDRRRGFAASARRGAEHARGEIVVLIRDAAVPAPGWLAPLAAALDIRPSGLSPAPPPVLPGAADSPVAAWSVAIRAADLRGAELPIFPANSCSAPLDSRRPARRASHDRARQHHRCARRAHRWRPSPRRRASPELTVVIPTLDAASERVRGCIAAVQAPTEVAHEIVIIDNGAPPQGFASPVNAGRARGPHPVRGRDERRRRAAVRLVAAAPRRARRRCRRVVPAHDRRPDALRLRRVVLCDDARQRRRSSPTPPASSSTRRSCCGTRTPTCCTACAQAGRPPVHVEDSRIRHGLSETVGSEDPELSAWIRVQVAADRERFLRKHPGVAMNGHALAS